MTGTWSGVNKWTSADSQSPGASSDILGSDFEVDNDLSTVLIYVALDASDVFKLTRDDSDEKMEKGSNLEPDSGYVFEVPAEQGEALNFQVEAAGTTVKKLIVAEVSP